MLELVGGDFIFCSLFPIIDQIFSEIVYRDVVENWFKGPTLMTPKGRVIWTGSISFMIFFVCLASHSFHNSTGLRLLVTLYVKKILTFIN